MTAGFATAIDGAANVFLDAASAYDWPAPTARAFARLSAAAMGRGMTPAIARLSASHRVRQGNRGRGMGSDAHGA